jgi:hypothetical protein
MAEPKTKPSTQSAAAFVAGLDPSVRADAAALLELMGEASGKAPTMWGTSMVGFGRCHMVYDSGRELDWFLVGFSPRKANLTLYIMPGFARYDALLATLGKHSLGKSCLYVKRLADVDLDVLRTLVRESVAAMRAKYPEGGEGAKKPAAKKPAAKKPAAKKVSAKKVSAKKASAKKASAKKATTKKKPTSRT